MSFKLWGTVLASLIAFLSMGAFATWLYQKCADDTTILGIIFSTTTKLTANIVPQLWHGFSQLFAAVRTLIKFLWRHKWVVLGVVSFFAGPTIYFFRDRVIPFCDPWRNNNNQFVTTLPYSRFISDVAIYSCCRSGLARDTAILNIVTFNKLANVSLELSSPLVETTELETAYSETKSASEWIAAETRQISTLPPSVAMLQDTLMSVSDFKSTFLHSRVRSLTELDSSLQDFKREIKYRRDADDTSISISRTISTRSLLPKPWSKDLSYQLKTTSQFRGLLNSLFKDASELLELVHTTKEKVETIGGYIVFLRYLKLGGQMPSDQRSRYFERVTGAPAIEILAFEEIMKDFNQPNLELTIFNLLPQLKSARKTLKKILAIRAEGDKLGLMPSEERERVESWLSGKVENVGDIEQDLETRIEVLKELKMELNVMKASLPVKRAVERKKRTGSF
ncbi:uncharacterized protein LY89DRAFT_788219 [Mollisia scopiformis]|uniref:Uncharacterized protein n=1 Tax=Mollisia scopiformis TaxID=149040 RepID=A0A132BA99_MOLSC|nr:uncharacterized protein LY89DRAFT_788219 [Mollisia scopiformis]KUJ09330.1 hypothetical protein LY89DRAFT_788219 [Mollisia scopiformis]